VREKTGLILNMQRMSTEDGPGLRTTVFFKGCPLRCRWCHNPESLSYKRELEWFDDRCIGCRTCEKICPVKAIGFENQKLVVDYSLCTRCMKCAESCPANALEAKGVFWEAGGLADELAKDHAYFGEEGGVTLSGGETLAQPDFAVALCEKLHQKGIQVAIDTCGMVDFSILKRVFPYTDIFLYDIKIMDSKLHKKHAGAGNEKILSNLRLLAAMIENSDKNLWIRTPIIPGATDSHENIRQIADFLIAEAGTVLSRWELCAFNNMCESKYKRLGYNWDYAGKEKLTRSHLDELLKAAVKNENLRDRTFITGSAKLEV